MSNELKPCPSCGNDKVYIRPCISNTSVRCKECDIEGPTGDHKEAESKWNALPRKIKLTKTLPSEAGRYYWAEFLGGMVHIAEVTTDKSTGRLQVEVDNYATMLDGVRGYWAKVEQDQFEFEG